MTKENYKISKIQIGFYYLLMFLILIWFLVIQFTGINNHNAKIQSSDITYRGTFTWIHLMEAKNRLPSPDITMFLQKRLWSLPQHFLKIIRKVHLLYVLLCRISVSILTECFALNTQPKTID